MPWLLLLLLLQEVWENFRNFFFPLACKRQVFLGAVGRVGLAQISNRFAAVPAVSAFFGLGMPTSEILVDNLISEILYIARLDNDDEDDADANADLLTRAWLAA